MPLEQSVNLVEEFHHMFDVLYVCSACMMDVSSRCQPIECNAVYIHTSINEFVVLASRRSIPPIECVSHNIRIYKSCVYLLKTNHNFGQRQITYRIECVGWVEMEIVVL